MILNDISPLAWIIPVAAVFVIIVVAVLFKFRNKSLDEDILENEKVFSNDSNEWIKFLGTKENIKSVKTTGSRISIEVKDTSIVEKENLKTLGVSNVVVMSNKVTLVVEHNASEVAKIINDGLI